MPVTATFTGRAARCGAVVTLIGAALTFAVGPAHAAGEGHAWVGQHAFHFRAASGHENQVYMWRDVARFYVQDNGAPVTQGSGCFRQTSRRVVIVGTCLLGGLAVTQVVPGLAERALGLGTFASVLSFVARWVVAVAAMLLVVCVLIRYAPAEPVRWRWVGTGTLVTVGSWTLTSIGFGAYLAAW